MVQSDGWEGRTSLVPNTEPLPEEEQQLIERAQSGDRSAQDELFRRYAPGLHAWIRLKRTPLLRMRESTVDLVQSTFGLALRDLRRFEFRGIGSFRNWLLTYANHKLQDREKFYRAAKRSPAMQVDESLSNIYGTICTPSDAASAREQVKGFENAFAQLAGEDQQVILMAKLEGLPHAEIAASLGKSEQACRKMLSRALVRLASKMTGSQS